MGEDLESEEAQRRLARLLTAATCVLNLAGHKDRLLMGGKGAALQVSDLRARCAGAISCLESWDLVAAWF